MDDLRISKENMARIHSPAGIDIQGQKPEKVAISILAEIIQLRNSGAISHAFKGFAYPVADTPPGVPQWYINPVCGVPVNMNKPKHVVT